MKIIIYLDHSQKDGNQVRFRSSEKPAFHILEAGDFSTLEDALEYAETFQRGAETAGAETVLAINESVFDEVSGANAFPKYLNEMMSHDFSKVWEAIT